MTIKIGENSDCKAELEELSALMKKDRRYTYKDFTPAEIVSIAIDRLYDEVRADLKNSENVRKI